MGDMTDDDYTFEDHVRYKQYEKDFLKTMSCKIEIPKECVDRWNIRRYNFWERVYKRLFPTRFEINQKVKKFMIRKQMERFVKRVDKFLAWGDPLG